MANCSNLMNHSLTISSGGADFVLAGIQGNPTPWDLVEAPPNIGAIFSAYRSCLASNPEFGPAEKTLDLVSHSYSNDHLLMLGHVPSDDQAQFKKVVENFLIEDEAWNPWMGFLSDPQLGLKTLGITQVRLLGCLTACTSAGRQAMSALHEALDMPVLGTTRLLSQLDFKSGEFAPTSPALFSTDDLPSLPTCSSTFPDGSNDVLDFAFEKSDEFTREDLRGLAGARTVLPSLKTAEERQLTDLIGRGGKGKSLPGLLTVPTWQYRVAVEGEHDRFRLLQILFDWQIVNVFSRRAMIGRSSDRRFADSACYMVQDPMGLWSFMTGLSRPMPVPPRPRMKSSGC